MHRKLEVMLTQPTVTDGIEADLEALAGSPREPMEEALDGRVLTKAGDLAAGTLIDQRYRLLTHLGQGGMGEVWSAKQLQPVERLVALKILRRGSMSQVAAARLRSERQALATMDHPHIARVYDGGELADGSPYFVMELVPDGLPITTYCRRHGLGLEARLRLMQKVCDAMEHAHQKRIIHRDLKPSNVLVRASGDVKVIDFGIAKLLSTAGEANAGETLAGELVGTPEYMSPEQASFGAIDVDTRTDVYSLGLMLYELLVGELPLGPETRDLPLGEQCRRIREMDPPRPSTQMRRGPARNEAREADKAAGAGDGDSDGGPRFHAWRGNSWKRVRGDLDRIVLTALAKDREHRYPSVAALEEDLERYLRHQPIRVAPQTVGYQVGKFIRRHRLAVAVATLALLAIAVAVAGIATGLVRARKAEALARTEAATTRQISEFLEGLLREGNPEEAEGAGSLRGLLDRGAERVRSELHGEPAVRARLMLTIANAYRALGEYGPALELAEESLSVYRSMASANPRQIASALEVLTHVLMNSREHERALEAAQEHYRVLAEALGDEHPDLAESLFQVGTAHWYLGDFERARQTLEQAIAYRTKELHPVPESLPRMQNNLAILYWQLDRMEDAERLYRQALSSLRALRGPEHPHVAATLNNLALVYEKEDDYEQALGTHRQALAIREKIFERPHPDLAETLNNMGTSLNELGRKEEARAVLEQALADRRAIFGEGANDLVATTLFNLAKAQPDGEEKRARELFREALGQFEKSVGKEHPMVAFPLFELGSLDLREERYEAALPMLERALAIRREALPADHPLTLAAHRALCDTLQGMGSTAERDRLACADVPSALSAPP